MTEATGDDRPRFRWAVVGVGRHSRLYVIPALAASERGELAALVTSRPESAQRFAAQWGAPRTYETYGDALADREIDGVFLVTPNDAHRQEVLAAAEAGKHVLCEKPLATSVEDAEEMVRACREAGVVLGTGFHLRHNLVHRRARDLIAEGRIGEVRFASVRYAHRTAPRAVADVAVPTAAEIPSVATWRKNPAVTGGGAFVGTGSHAIDILRFLTGEDLLDVRVCADADGMHEHNLVLAGRMTGGVIGTVHGGDLPFPVNETVVSGSLGSVVCRGSVGNHGEGTVTLITAAGEKTWTPPIHNVYVRECDAFVQAVEAGTEADASGLDGLRCQEVIQAIYESVSSNRLERVHRALASNEPVKE
jgi:1,5-anhydro-D-fructose reductase (1,5-anhydro-D-mannitol-forming)